MAEEEEGKEDNEEEDDGRRRGGGYALGREANFSWSRALAHPRGGTERITGSSEVKMVS